MLHRPADSRLLANLLSHEKDYTKALNVQLDVGHASLASFSAYAAASPPPASRAIAAVAGALVGAQDALRSYALAVDEWCEQLRMLKELEDEVGNIVRDREILVDRLIKASKSKDTKRRSLISGTGGSPTTSLFSASSSSTALEQLAFTNSKLNVAQSELQACETHLAEREQELAKMRQATIVKGLKGRCSALRDCGWKWEEMAKDALRALESMSFAQTDMANFRDRQPDSRPSSDLSSSLAPSQSASQSGHPDYSSQGHSSISSPVNMLLAPPEAHPENDILNEPTQTQYRLSLPAAHALTDEDQHNYVPSRIDLPPPVPAHRPSPVMEDDELDGSSAGEESDDRAYEVHENAQFSTPENRRPEAKTRGSGSTVRLPLLRQHAKKAATDESDRHSILPASISAPLPVFPSSLTPAQAQKIDPYGNLTGSNRGHMDDLDGSPRQRKWSSIFSGLFHKRGRTMSMSASAGAGHSSLSTDGGGWRTRTDRNLKMVGRADDSSDEEDARRLPALSSAAIDYDALRQKSLVEAKTLPNPGPSGSHLRESSETASTKSSPGMKGQQGRKKLRKTADTVRKRNASAVDISSRSLDTSDISSRAVKGGLKPSQANDSSDRTTRRQTISDIPKQAIPPHVRALQTGGETSSASVTRSSTITSIASSTRSAPTNRATSLDVPPSQLKATKRGSGTWSDGGRPGVNGMSTAKGTPPRMGHTRTGSQGGQVQLGGTAAGRGQASLMSIVEGVSQQNRRGWGQTNPDSLLFQAKAPGAVTNASPSNSLPFNAVQPPPRLSSSSSLDDHSPRSGVVGKRRILTSAAAQNADLRRLSTISASSSEPSLPLKGTSSITTPTPSHTRPVMAQKVPLRSAMRNHSSSPKNSSGTSTPRSASPVRFSGKTTTAPPLAETSETARQAHPGALRLATSQANGIVKDDDSASIASSYETGREDFDDDATEGPPTPPPHDPMPAPAHALQALPAGLVSGLKTNGTQTSSSMSGGTATPPSRRKSVRVSLQPTFSPTPPATYDDEEDHHPWGDTRPQQQPGSWKTRAEPAEDVWDNSSDEDEDYSRAKQMLHSASKKLEKTAHMTGLK